MDWEVIWAASALAHVEAAVQHAASHSVEAAEALRAAPLLRGRQAEHQALHLTGGVGA